MDFRLSSVSLSLFGTERNEKWAITGDFILSAYFLINLYPARRILFLATALLDIFFETEKQNLLLSPLNTSLNKKRLFLCVFPLRSRGNIFLGILLFLGSMGVKPISSFGLSCGGFWAPWPHQRFCCAWGIRGPLLFSFSWADMWLTFL